MSFIISIESFVFPVNETEVAASRRDGCTPHTLLRPTGVLAGHAKLITACRDQLQENNTKFLKGQKKKKIEEKQFFFLTFGPA